MKKNNWFGIFILVVLAIASIIIIAYVDKETYGETCSSPPSEFWIQEDLEFIFLTTELSVLEMDDYDGDLIVKICIYEEGAYRIYRCLYQVKRIWIGAFEWKFERYVV